MGNRVLVIDDSQTIRKLVELSFRALPFTVEYATTGTAGLAQAQATPPDVVLLDMVLPDMRGLDVCRHLARDERTARCQLVLMSAKDPSVREQFRSYPQVVGYLHKPFTAPELLASVEEARRHSAGSPPAPARRAPRFAFAQKEALAKDLYARLRSSLAHIPAWMEELGSAQPASFFARKLLTPELIDELTEALLPHLEKALPGAAREEPREGVLSGRLDGFAPLDLLRAVAGERRTGVLTLRSQGRRTWLYFQRGALRLVTTDDPLAYQRGAEADLAAVPAEAREAAEAEQARGGKPLFVSLAEAGLLPSGHLSRLLHAQGRRALLEVLDAQRLDFSFALLPALPLHADAQGREISFAQLELEQLRRSAGTLTSEHGPEALQWVFERVPGFSRRLRQFSLEADERRVLALVDGRQPVTRLVRRADLPPGVVTAVLHRLARVDLIRRAETAQLGAPRVVVIDGDAEGVVRPLERLLAARPRPAQLIEVRPSEPDLLAAVLKARPTLVLVDASGLGERALELGRRAFAAPELAHVATAALVAQPDPAGADALLAAGFDAVLPKPVWFGDLERMLEEQGASAWTTS